MTTSAIRKSDLVTVVFPYGQKWTMSVMEGMEEEFSTEDRLRAAIGLVTNDEVELWGVWGDRGSHLPENLVPCLFAEGTTVLAAYIQGP